MSKSVGSHTRHTFSAQSIWKASSCRTTFLIPAGRVPPLSGLLVCELLPVPDRPKKAMLRLPALLCAGSAQAEKSISLMPPWQAAIPKRMPEVQARVRVPFLRSPK